MKRWASNYFSICDTFVCHFFSLFIFCLGFSNYRLCPANAFFSLILFVSFFVSVSARDQPMPFLHDVLAFDLLIGSLLVVFFWFTGIVWKAELTNWICSFSLCGLWMMWLFNLMGEVKPNERTHERRNNFMISRRGVNFFFHSLIPWKDGILFVHKNVHNFLIVYAIKWTKQHNYMNWKFIESN